MKKIIIALGMMIVFSQAAFAGLPTILVNNVSPQPVEPGKDVTIDITLFNRLTTDTGLFSVALEPYFPIIFKSSTDTLTGINLCNTCNRNNKYFISIDPSALSGIYPLYIKAYAGGTEVRQRIDINVQGKPNIVFTTDDAGLSHVTPDEMEVVILDVKNVGSGQARQIKIYPDSQYFTVIGGSTKTIDAIAPGTSEQVEFDLIGATDMEANSYVLPFRISYLDENGNQMNTTQSLGLKVINKGTINIQTVKTASATGPVTEGQPFTVVVRLENIGPGNADAISADITCPFNGAKKAFVGRLKNNEDAPAVFDMVSQKSGTFTCDVTIFHTDDLGDHNYTKQFDLTIAPANNSGLIIFVIIIAVLAYVFRNRILSFVDKNKHHSDRRH